MSILPSLHELQHVMLDAIVGGSNGIEELLRPSAPSASRRLQVYRNTVRENFLRSLESTYPVVQRLAGTDYFTQTVNRFQAQHPSRSGDLTAAGADFACFLERSLGVEFAYLADVARFEWLLQEAALADNATAFDLQRLAGVPLGAYDSLHFQLNPSARLFVSHYPCVAIWQANVDPAREPVIIDLAHAPCAVAIVRTRRQLEFHTLTQGELRLLTAFAEGAPFAAALEEASRDPAFDAAAALQKFVRNEIVVDFT